MYLSKWVAGAFVIVSFYAVPLAHAELQIDCGMFKKKPMVLGVR